MRAQGRPQAWTPLRAPVTALSPASCPTADRSQILPTRVRSAARAQGPLIVPCYKGSRQS